MWYETETEKKKSIYLRGCSFDLADVFASPDPHSLSSHTDYTCYKQHTDMNLASRGHRFNSQSGHRL